MSITTELREYASSLAMKAGASTTEVKGALEEIADHIDQEHDGEVFGLLREHDEWVHDRDANYIQLPKDADGETIHLGDELEEGKVARIVLTDSDWEPSVYVYKLPNVMHEYFCSDVGHAKPDSWERIIADAAATRGDFDELVARCKRLAGEK